MKLFNLLPAYAAWGFGGQRGVGAVRDGRRCGAGAVPGSGDRNAFPVCSAGNGPGSCLQVKTNAAEASVSYSCEFFALWFVAGYVTAAVVGG